MAGFYYINELIMNLKKNGYTIHESDLCTTGKVTNMGRVVAYITVDDFLVVDSTQAPIDELYNMLNRKYTFKRLGKPTQFLGWKVTNADDGSIK